MNAKAFIIYYLNALADTQIGDLLPAYRAIIPYALRLYGIIVEIVYQEKHSYPDPPYYIVYFQLYRMVQPERYIS